MFLQGSLQVVFDALFAVGAIDPVLKMDWSKITDEMRGSQERVHQILRTINSYKGNYHEVLNYLYKLDQRSLNYVAMEVAREFCEYQDRSTLH